MKRRVLALILLGCTAVFGFVGMKSSADEPRTKPIRWYHDIFEAHDASVESGKPMLILVSASWCEPCKKLKKSTLGDPRMERYINAAFIPVHLDFDRDERIVDILEVEEVPSTVVLSPDADLLGRLVGYAGVREYYLALEQSRRVQSEIEVYRQASATKER